MATNSVPWTRLFERIIRGCISSRCWVRRREIRVKRPSKRTPKRQQLFVTEAGRLELARVTSGHEGGRYLLVSTPLLHFITIKASPEIRRVRIAVELAHSRQSHGRTSTHDASRQ